MLSTTIILASLAAAITATPTAVKRADNTLPWEITWFNANKYSPKNHNARINITISEPNEIRLQQTPTGYAVLPKFEANCHWSWDWFEDPFPFDKVMICTLLGNEEIYGNLTMTLRAIGEEDPSPGSVDVDIVEARSVTVLGTEYVL
ncbi:hypothetical protein E8E13_006184 [Curvularia kusanoi]|uniref:Uncharacterized protein n=1 Tax=Curvularia kusanoi TaxID=90978 RepID=A0A9P4T7D6_CURKU|nr:hypothetical protein E8E13_006184 [Curvularia kusanoi]